MVFILKGGRASQSNAKDYRPISLSSFILKMLERLVDQHIRKRGLAGKPLHRKQHACQPGKSIESALHKLVSKIDDTLDQKHVDNVYSEGAFDNTSYESMEQAARNLEIQTTICRWVKYMLHSRQIQTRFLDTDREVLVTNLYPQGRVLLPLLWRLEVDGLLTMLN